MENGRRVKILHVLATVSQGGVETWLCNLLARFDQSKFQFDICFYRRSGEELKDYLLSLNAAVFEIPLKDTFCGLLDFIANLRELIRRGNYGAVHCHGMSFTGAALYCAWRERVPIRIAHSHASSEPTRALAHTTFLFLAKQAARHFATHQVGCSTEAAEALFGRGCLSKNASVLYCGIDLSKQVRTNSALQKESLGVPSDATTIGCIANFNAAKNHAFLLKVFARIIRHDAEAHLILVGDGPNKDFIEKQALTLGIANRIHLLGRRNDVSSLLAIFDVFVLPSLTEGLPLALLESQVHGVPCLTSTAVTREVEVVPGLVKFLPLTADVELWARTALAMVHCEQSLEPNHRAFECSPYNIDCGVSRLAQIYLSQ